MIRSIQKRFIVTAMAAITVLLIVLLGGINIVNYVMTQRQTGYILDTLVDSRGAYDPPGAPVFQDDRANKLRPDAPRPDDMLGARYFIVFFDADGEVRFTDSKHIYAVSEDEAAEIAQKAYAKASNAGRYEQFEYAFQQTPDGGSLAVFLDASVQQASRLNVLFASCGGGAFCWLMMLLLVSLLSKRAIRPIAVNFEKQKQFVTNAGHEIKTPLAIILANTDAMELHTGENKWSRNIRAQTIRLTGLMQNLLTLARLDEDNIVLPMTEFSFNLLLEEVMDPFYEAAQAKQIEPDLDMQRDITIKANRESMQQLVSILMDNAVKYTPPGGSIHVTLRETEQGICLRVKNTLDDAAELAPDRLFERFYRADAARTQKTGGYGIGLSAAKAIVDAHRGRISACLENGAAEIVFTVVL